VGYGEGVSPLGQGSGEGAVPLPRKKFDFGSQIGEFWCKPGVKITLGTLFTGVPAGNDP